MKRTTYVIVVLKPIRREAILRLIEELKRLTEQPFPSHDVTEPYRN